MPLVQGLPLEAERAHPDRDGGTVTRAAAIAVLALLACGSPRPAPLCRCAPATCLPVPPPELFQHLEVLEARTLALKSRNLELAGEVERARRIRDAENAVLLARSRRERDAAARKLLVARRSP